jgi:two-component system NtrC family sensor kinase
MPTLFLITAILMYVYGPKREAIKWLIFTLSFAALYDMTHLIASIILPFMKSYGWSYSSTFIVLKLLPTLTFLHEVFTPYGFLVFSIVHSELTSHRTKYRLTVALTLPIILMFANAAVNDQLELNYQMLLIWVGPYYLGTCFLLIIAYLKERNPKKKNLRFIAACIVVPSTVANLALDNVAKAYGFQINELGYLYIFGGIAFVVFVLFAIRYGAFGVKIKFEKQLLDQTITGIATGTAMLNHALKNRITNMDMLVSRMKETSRIHNYKSIDGDVDLIFAETKQMMQMVKRIQKQIEEIEIIERTDNLNDIVIQALETNRYLLESKQISVTTNYPSPIQIKCDKFHLQKGQLSVTIYDNKKFILIDLTDNGKGVTEEAAAKIFDPFFSTKYREDNFGLGLSYCYLVMQKHGGKIEVSSNQDVGTTFTVQLPKNRIVS